MMLSVECLFYFTVKNRNTPRAVLLFYDLFSIIKYNNRNPTKINISVESSEVYFNILI